MSSLKDSFSQKKNRALSHGENVVRQQASEAQLYDQRACVGLMTCVYECIRSLRETTNRFLVCVHTRSKL